MLANVCDQLLDAVGASKGTASSSAYQENCTTLDDDNADHDDILEDEDDSRLDDVQHVTVAVWKVCIHLSASYIITN